MKTYHLFLISIILLIIQCCNNPEQNVSDKRPPQPPPVPSADEYCDSLRARTYADLNESNKIELITNDFSNNTDKMILFEDILLKKFNMQLLPIHDSVFYPRCIMPIMDSVIQSKYGVKGKDSIIKLVTRLTDSLYNIDSLYKY